ncbi:MAG TPA: type I DNA topoisomerase, partial [Acholeplasmataceae bacterium]|nr:type I DNA topoisomerase [Acholeplasmataceae bacterium]
VGHIRDLATSGKGGLGVDVDNNFEPTYKIIKGKHKLVTELKKKTKGKEVLIATDPDREGEAIAWHIADELGLDLNENNRIVFKEITKPAVMAAIDQKRKIDLGLVNSQESRRILDRIIGFKLSRLLRKKIKSRSAGRVQSVALKLIVDLEREIERFVPETYYTIHAHFGDHVADYVIPKDTRIDLKTSNQIVETSKNPFIVEDIQEREVKRQAKPPYMTSTLLQDGVNSLYMSSSRVMAVASELYQGIEIAGQIIGLITYMRTDSNRLSKEFVDPAKRFIEENYGKNYLGFYRTSKKDSSQDAHEAIRPTDVKNTPEKMERFLTQDQYKVYKRIYERAVGSLMAPAVFKSTKVTLNSNDNIYAMDGSILVFDGHLKVTGEQNKDKTIPVYQVGQELVSDQVEKIEKQTLPPARFNEASLIKTLESNGIGRPSTYATIIKTIRSRDYVTVENRRFKPTEQGKLTVDTLNQYFTQIMDTNYTSNMEKELDQIADGKVDHIALLRDFYDRFIPLLEMADEKMEKIKPVVTDKICPNCGGNLVIRKSKYGEFYGCSNYPKC